MDCHSLKNGFVISKEMNNLYLETKPTLSTPYYLWNMDKGFINNINHKGVTQAFIDALQDGIEMLETTKNPDSLVRHGQEVADRAIQIVKDEDRIDWFSCNQAVNSKNKNGDQYTLEDLGVYKLLPRDNTF